MITLLILTLLLTFAGTGAQTGNKAPQMQKWKQIRLMRSTRDDVEKLLGQSKFRGYFATYNVDDGVLRIEYYPFNSCTEADADLKVPKWTVVQITYEPSDRVKLADLNLDLKKFRKVRESPHLPDLISYVSDEDGVDYTFEKDETLNSVRYFPAKRYDRVRCKQSRGN